MRGGGWEEIQQPTTRRKKAGDPISRGILVTFPLPPTDAFLPPSPKKSVFVATTERRPNFYVFLERGKKNEDPEKEGRTEDAQLSFEGLGKKAGTTTIRAEEKVQT